MSNALKRDICKYKKLINAVNQYLIYIRKFRFKSTGILVMLGGMAYCAFLGTVKLHQIIPYNWQTTTLTKLSDFNLTQIGELLPHRLVRVKQAHK